MCCVLIAQRYPVVMSTYLGVMGRVLLQNTSFFSSLLNEMAHKFNQEVRIYVLKEIFIQIKFGKILVK